MEFNKNEIYMVATPIGNLDDITLRAVKVLNNVDLIAAEDTRNTGKLLAALEIKKKLISFHEHNENDKADYLIDLALNGTKIAVVSDAGTPLISDPGYRLIEKGIKKGIRFVPIPGVSALTTLVCVSGLATDRFAFFGFLPHKESARDKLFLDLQKADYPVMFYESPKRILKTIEELIDKTGNRRAVLGRELTKIHEEVIRGTLSEIKDKLEQKDKIRGEICFFVEGGKKEMEKSEEDILDIVKNELEKSDEKPKKLAEKLGLKLGMKKKEVYEIILKIQGKK